MDLVETLEFQYTQRSEDSYSFLAQNWRLAHNQRVTVSTDLRFGIKGSLMGLVETLEFQNTQRSEDSFIFLAQNEVCTPSNSSVMSQPLIWLVLES